MSRLALLLSALLAGGPGFAVEAPRSAQPGSNSRVARSRLIKISWTPSAVRQALSQRAPPRLGTLAGLQDIAKDIAVQAKAEPAQVAAAAGEFFDRTRVQGNSSAVDLSLEAESELPEGVVRIDKNLAKEPEDIDRLIPRGANSAGLIDKLKRQMKAGKIKKPFFIYTYHGKRGQPFAGVDLSQDLDLINNFPELESHEIKLLRKLQAVTADVRVLPRQEGKTPDTEIGNTFIELKSLMGDRVNVAFLINKANQQVLEHARRHGLGNGGVAMDLTKLDKVPVDSILEQLEAWRKMPASSPIPGDYWGARMYKKEVVLDKIWMFAGSEYKMFARQGDGPYRLIEPPHLPLRSSAPMKFAGADSPAKPTLILPQDQKIGPPVDIKQMALELDTSWRVLAKKGIRAVIPVYGSARLLPAEKARLEYRKVLARTGLKPKNEQDWGELESARWMLEEGSRILQQARRFGELVGRFAGREVTVMIGGGSSVMQEVNKGALEAQGWSAGVNIKLPHEQVPNPFVSPELGFSSDNFPPRKINLQNGAIAHVTFFGGIGTMDEFFQILTLIQNRKTNNVPLIIVELKDEWRHLKALLQDFARKGVINKKDLDLIQWTKSADEAWGAIVDFYRR